MRILIAGDFLNLSCPANNCRFKSLQQILALSSGLRVYEIFLRNVQGSSALSKVWGFSQGTHELVQLCHEFFLDPIRPFLLSQELWKFCVHFSQNVLKRISFNYTDSETVLNVIIGNTNVPSLLQKVYYLIVSRVHTARFFVERRRASCWNK